MKPKVTWRKTASLYGVWVASMGTTALYAAKVLGQSRWFWSVDPMPDSVHLNGTSGMAANVTRAKSDAEAAARRLTKGRR